ncbi:PH domain-containing protein [Populibacterium corticicola]|uniref:PH domain-containing protein n=1 Tax=Populibacterium corticicola TaxID=1812826 RepID=A0ABW5XIX4_9MICO
MDPIFDPEGIEWQRVSPKLTHVRLLTWFLSMLVPLIGSLVLAIVIKQVWAYLIPAGVLVLFSWVAWVIRRQVPAMGYAEREDDLLVKKGVMFKSITVVPYGRMQLVDVEAGPFDRAFGIAKVTLHTASAQTDAVVSGLVPEEAARLRDRLASRGESRLAGL